MEWPSKNVAHGGILHPAKSNYNPETHKFLRVLLEETKMSMHQRKKMDYYLRNGEPLPLPTSRSTDELSTRRQSLPKIAIRPGSSRRRSRETILKSGAYEREKFIRLEPTPDREKEKNRLINRLAFGRDVEPKPPKIKVKKEKPGETINRFDQLVNEIKEREEWLQKMEELGQGSKHKLIIQQQIQARVREMQKLKLEEAENKE